MTRQKGPPAVLVSVEDFAAYEETACLMASLRHGERLERAVAEAEAEAGKTEPHDLIDP